MWDLARETFCSESSVSSIFCSALFKTPFEILIRVNPSCKAAIVWASSFLDFAIRIPPKIFKGILEISGWSTFYFFIFQLHVSTILGFIFEFIYLDIIFESGVKWPNRKKKWTDITKSNRAKVLWGIRWEMILTIWSFWYV